MTCREFILYILKNGLEDEQMFKDGRFIGFKTVEEVAEEIGVGSETVRVWVHLDMIKHIEIGDTIFIPESYRSPLGVTE